MAVKKLNHIQTVAPKGDDELAVRTRLQILLQLALTIGSREGLFTHSYVSQNKTTASERDVQEGKGNG